MNDGSTAGYLILLLPLLLLAFLVFSNTRRRRQLEEFQASIGVGDEVVTTAGIFGTIVAIDSGIAHLEVAKGVVIRIDRRAIGMRAADRPEPKA
ncbi:MAG: preprotein translocase subunit YajC [Actinomycetales bacterium]|nr:preprotein translocase subunit YajC [Tetrasphaera sp.]NLX00778.1 preprotein translocase subunit YajC [Actinomycetales bacterium]